jgi:hypothetical protein
LERSGYPAVVGKAVDVLRALFARSESEQIGDEFEKWSGVQRLVATIGHSNVDVRVFCVVFLAQLSKNRRWGDSIALSKGYRVLVELMSKTDREQLAALVTLRVLLQATESNISDFARAGGFNALFRLLRGEVQASTKVLGQTMDVLSLCAQNRNVSIEIKASKLETDILKHLSNNDETLQKKTLDCMGCILEDEAGLAFVRKNNNAVGTLTAYNAMNSKYASTTNALLAKLQ